jgi:hypothetical protein
MFFVKTPTESFHVKSSSFKRNCHPDPDSCHVALDRAACAPFRKERRMKCINATNLNRNAGERSRATCGAPRPRTKASVPLVLPQNGHPERSRRNLGDAYLTHAVRSFSTTEPAPGGPATVFPWSRRAKRCQCDSPPEKNSDQKRKKDLQDCHGTPSPTRWSVKTSPS